MIDVRYGIARKSPLNAGFTVGEYEAAWMELWSGRLSTGDDRDLNAVLHHYERFFTRGLWCDWEARERAHLVAICDELEDNFGRVSSPFEVRKASWLFAWEKMVDSWCGDRLWSFNEE